MPDPHATPFMARRPLLWIAMGVLVGLAFAYTAWQSWYLYRAHYDDAFIQYRIARNISEGLGPYYNAGGRERTDTSLIYHYFSSLAWVLPFKAPIEATAWLDLILMLGSWLLLGAGMARVAARRFGFAEWAGFGFATLLVASRMAVNYGMETQLYTLYLSAVFWLMAARRTEQALMLSCLGIFLRPEATLLTACCYVQPLLFGGRPAGGWSLKALVARVGPRAIAVAFVAVAVYAAYCLHYFGTLAPHTAMVKRLFLGNVQQSLTQLWQDMLRPASIPTYLIGFSVLGLAWGLMRAETFALALFAIGYTAFFTLFGTWGLVFGWYRTPLRFMLDGFAFLGGCVFLHYLLRAGAALGRRVGRAGIARVCGGLFLAASTFYIYKSFALSHIMFTLYDTEGGYERVIEAQKGVGAYLEQVVPPGKAVMVEPLGIIGYYAPHTRFKDFPGLASLEVFHCLQAYMEKARPTRHFFYSDNTDELFYILDCVPDIAYLVLREGEYLNLSKRLGAALPGKVFASPIAHTTFHVVDMRDVQAARARLDGAR